jgi:hypothetical protein
MMEKYSLPQLNSINNNLIFLLIGALVHFADIIHSCLKVNFA